MSRVARINLGPNDDAEKVAKYLPQGYEVIVEGNDFDGKYVIIEGTDIAGWTLDDYVLPRLASGLMFGEEVSEDYAALH